MTTESAIESPDWQFAEEDTHNPASLIVQLRRGRVILPWFRFVYAEGHETSANIIWSTHGIQITGAGLGSLLEGVASQRIVRLIEPFEKEARFEIRESHAGKYTGPAIHSLIVTKFEE